MKKGYFLTGDYSGFEKEINMIKTMLDEADINVEIVNFNDINVLAVDDFDGKIFVKGEEVDCPDFIVPGVIRERDVYKFKAVSRMLETFGVKCVTTVDGIDKVADKIYSFQLAKQYVPEVKIPKTILISDDVTLDMIEEQIGFPLVLKIMDGSQGKGVCLVESKDELDNILTIVTASEFGQELMAQEAILSSKGRDIRLVVGGGQLIHSFSRYNESSFKSNIHQGGSLQTFDAPQSLIDMSVKLIESFGLGLGSIDYLFGENEDEFYLCELNSLPGISYIFAAKESGDTAVIDRYTDAIKRAIM